MTTANKKEEIIRQLRQLPVEERLSVIRQVLSGIDRRRSLTLAAELLDGDYRADEDNRQCFNCLDTDEFYNYEQG